MSFGEAEVICELMLWLLGLVDGFRIRLVFWLRRDMGL